MEALLYLNLTSKTASESLTGARFRFPIVSFGEDLTISFRLLRRLGSTLSEVTRTITAVRCSIGRVDARPTTGNWGFEIGASSGDIVSSVDVAVSATDLATAINAIAAPSHGLGTASCTYANGSWFVTFANETTATYGSAIAIDPLSTNSLDPTAFVQHSTFSRNGYWVHELRLVQTPVAFTDESSLDLPDPPTIARVTGGETTSDVAINEVQSIYIPPNFRGVYQIARGLTKTALLDIRDGVTQIQAALDPLADDGGEFSVTLLTDDKALIEFGGDMGGTGHDLLTVSVFSSPPGDPTFTIPLTSAALAAVLRESTAETVKLPIEIEAVMEDEDDDSITYTRTLLSDEIEIRREVAAEGVALSAPPNFLRPPLPERYIPYDYSQVSTGQLHYSVSAGDGTSNDISVAHNLDTENAGVIIRENVAGGAILVNGTDYTVALDNDNSLTITPAATVASNAWRITVLGLEQTSAFDPHTHPIGEITGLQAILDDLGARVTDLEDRSGGGAITVRDDGDTGSSALWELPKHFEVFPTRKTITDTGLRLIDLDLKQLGRSKGLLAAVHSATVTSMTSALPISSDHIGKVFENTSSSTIRLTGGKALSSPEIAPGEFAACDGRVWYEVKRYGDHASGTDFTTVIVDDVNALLAPDNELPNGTRVQLTTTDTLPDPLAVLTDYEVLNRTDDTIELTTVGGTTPITLIDNGTGTHTITKAVETSYYPAEFERELFTIHVNEKQLRLRKQLEARFALELAVLQSNTSASWTVAIEVGEKTAVATPATPGQNINQIVWRGTPILEQEVIVTPISSTHRLGARIARALVDSVDTITATRLMYGSTEGAVAPKSANFALRARLIRFDTEDNQPDPEGFVAIKGLAFEGSDAPTGEGFASIS